MTEFKTAYFTFGFDHVHRYGSKTLDHNIVVEMIAPDPRKKMFDLFGRKWSMQYEEKPNMEYYKEIFTIR